MSQPLREEHTGQSIHCRATHALVGSAALSHLVAEIFKDCQKDRGLFSKCWYTVRLASCSASCIFF